MNLDFTKLENLKKKSDNWTAQCPACAKAGGDSKGEHLFIASDGRFGCVAHQNDKAHNKEIFQFSGIQNSDGQREPIPIRIRRPACATRVPKTILVLKSLIVPSPRGLSALEEPAEEIENVELISEHNVPGEASPGLLSDPPTDDKTTVESATTGVDDMGLVVRILDIRRSLR